MGVVKMSEIRYKTVLRNESGELESLVALPPLRVVYEPNKWVRAPVGGLLVWSPEHKPQKLTPNLELWEVEVRNKMELPKRRFLLLVRHESILKSVSDLWEGKYRLSRDSNTRKWPKGTEAWKEVKLIRMIARGGE